MADVASSLHIVNISNLFIVGQDVITARQLKEAIDSYGGVRGCRAAVVEVTDTKKQTTGMHKISGISQLNNFQYTDDGEIIVWKAFQIGEGKRISKQELSKMGRPLSDTGVKIVFPSCEPDESTGLLKKKTTSKQTFEVPHVVTMPVTPPADQEDCQLFNCPEEGCVKTFRTSQNLHRHLDLGRHHFKLHEESQYDQIRCKWTQHCMSLKPQNPSSLFTAISCSEELESDVIIGWAQTRSKRSNRFSKQVKSFLLEQFMIGEETGRKVTPAEAAIRIRSLHNDAGNRLFEKGEWLTVQQVTSYFSRLAAMKKMSQLPTAVESLEDEGEDVEAVVQQSERYHLRQRIYNTLTL